MKAWIARDKEKYKNELWMYSVKPKKAEDAKVFINQGGTVMPLSDDEFPECTWENSPLEVEIKLKEE